MTDLDDLRTVADYQFGRGVGTALFGPDEDLSITRTSSGRPRQIHAGDERVVTYETDGRFRLGMGGGRRLQQGLPEDAYRVVVGDESEPFVREGRNTFATRCWSNTLTARYLPWAVPNSPVRACSRSTPGWPCSSGTVVGEQSWWTGASVPGDVGTFAGVHVDPVCDPQLWTRRTLGSNGHVAQHVLEERL